LSFAGVSIKAGDVDLAAGQGWHPVLFIKLRAHKYKTLQHNYTQDRALRASPVVLSM
jgi:hypothetical protein